jgi:hypothetical protein
MVIYLNTLFMHLVSFFKPIISDDLDKPVPLENQPFPYRSISNPRRFEELLYTIYRSKIDAGELDFDDVSLMSGVGEQGRDVMLFRDGKAQGVIQCKKYDRNYGLEEFGREITKLVLYSLLDDRIIPDRNNFTYHIAVAKDFVAGCRELIDDFNTKILEHSELAEWIQYNLKTPSLQSLSQQNDCLSEVKDVFSKITVKKIVPQDLDLELAGRPELQKLFFAVRTVTDNKLIEKLHSKFSGDLSEEQIGTQLRNGSISLGSEKNTFEGIVDSHIIRTETDLLMQWLSSDAKRDKNGVFQNICLLAAPAGYGKTVILKDFYDECRKKDLPVLGLKADKLYSYTITDLQKSIGLSLPIFDFIEICKKNYPLTVVIIDQIDALSQSMSADREYMDVFKGFIDRFEGDVNIRIIVSVRSQDLGYDPNLRRLKHNHTIKVQLLSEGQVDEQLQKLGIGKHRIGQKLSQLLRVPNNLNVFSRIVSNNESLGITTLEGLYTELWNQKVLRLPAHPITDKQKVRKALYTIAEKMFANQRITISVHQVEEFSDEILYLKSEHLIKEEAKQIQFFHQSFYDFVFAKQFVESEKDLVSFIMEAEQSIHIRSAVKMIITYMRDYDPDYYDKLAIRIIDIPAIFFHIKHIIFINNLSQAEPTLEEQKLVGHCLQASISYLVLFLEHAESEMWLKFALENKLLELQPGERSVIRLPLVEEEAIADQIQNIRINYLKNFVVANHPDAWEYLRNIEDKKIIQRILYFIEDWKNDPTFSLLDRCPEFSIKEAWSYWHVVGNIAKTNVDYTLAILAQSLPQHYKKGNASRDYEEREVLKQISKSHPQKLVPLLFECMRSDFEREIEDFDGLIRDWTYSHTDLRDEEHYDGREFLYQMLAHCLRKCANSYQDTYRSFFDSNKSSAHYAVLRIILYAVRGNENRFTEEVFAMFVHFKNLGLLTYGDDLEHDLRDAVEKSFAQMTPEQQNYIVKSIKGYRNKAELRSWVDETGAKKNLVKLGLVKILLAAKIANGFDR